MGMFDDVLNKVGEPYVGASGKGFEYGTHEVVIGTIAPKKTDTKDQKDCEIIEVEVFDKEDNDKKATCTLWFHTAKGAQMSVTKVLGLMVHKVSPDKKDKVRELGKKLFGSIDDPTQARDVAVKLMTEKLVGEGAFLFADPKGKYTTTSYGDLWHYPYEDPNADERADAAADLGGEDITKTKEAEAIPDFGDDL